MTWKRSPRFFFQNTLVEPQEPTVWKGRYGTFALMQYAELQNSALFQCSELQNLGADKTCTFQGWDFAELYRNGVVKDVNGGEVIKSALFRMDKSIDFIERLLNGTQ